MNKWLVVIPARLHSQRLPEKPLCDLAGKPLIIRVYENLAPLVTAGAKIIVATDDEKIVSACKANNVPVTMTRSDHPSGTDRCFEVAEGEQRDFIMNVQGDEPFVSTSDLAELAAAMESHSSADIGTLVFNSDNSNDFLDPNVVKAVRSSEGWALMFSRSPIPYDRDQKEGTSFWQHLGIYAFKKSRLKEFCDLPQSNLEKTEKLEQLRALENDWKIFLQPATELPLGIDTQEDLEAARARF